MLGYAQRFNLTLEDVNKEPGDVLYFFNGQPRPESIVVDQFREFVKAMREDLRRLSREVTAADHTAADVQLDSTTSLDVPRGQNARRRRRPVVKAAIVQAYIAEFGLAASEQSCLNFLLFIHADRRSKFTPFGVFSDERYHVLDGNDRIVDGLTKRCAGQIELGMELVRVRRTPAGADRADVQERRPDARRDTRRRRADDPVYGAAASGARRESRAPAREAPGDRRAWVRHERQDDGGILGAAVGDARRQRQLVLGSRESSDDVGD